MTPRLALKGLSWYLSVGATDEDGLVSKGADEAKRLGPYFRVLQNLKAPTPVHGVECLAET